MSLKLDRLIRTWFLRVVGICLAVLALNVLVYAFGVAKLGKMAEDEGAAAGVGQRTLADEEARSQKAAAQVQVFQDGRAVVDTLEEETFKTRGERMPEAQDEIRDLLGKAGLACDAIKYSYETIPADKKRAAAPRQYFAMGASFQATGSYPQIKAFLASLQASPHFYVVEDVSLSASSQGAVVLNLNARLTTYFRAVPAGLPAPAEAPAPAPETAP